MEGSAETEVVKTTPSQPWGAASSLSPWSQVSAQMPCSLEDVMSEELAKELQEEEEKSIGIGACNIQEDVSVVEDVASVAGETDDFTLAQMLQHQYDMEHDRQLQREQDKYNGPSKVTLSYKKYCVTHPALDDSDEEEEAEEWPEDDNPDNGPQFNKMGLSGKGKDMVTKHDAAICAKKNANKFMELPPGVETGDAVGMDMRLSNKVYNKLKQHSQSENKRSMRLHEKKEHSTAEMAVDEKTRLLLYKLMNQDILHNVNGVISTGKESVVLHADGGSMTEALVPSECALKVFKTTLTDFKNRAQYVKGDVRFFKDEFKKQNPRKIMKIWAEKEEFNLRRLEKNGIPVPRVIVLKKHVLVMEFLGRDHRPAPKLKDAHLSTADVQLAYDQCIDNMRRMYRDAGLVHADLSPYNMLWHNDMLYFIDVSQAVEKMHPKAHEFLLRDCTNISKFFKKAGVHKVMDEYELFNYVSGLDLKGEGVDFLTQVDDYEKNEERLRMGTGKDYAFDHYFSLAQKEMQAGNARLGEDSDDDEEEEEEDVGEGDEDCHGNRDGPEVQEEGANVEEEEGWCEVSRKHKSRKQ